MRTASLLVGLTACHLLLTEVSALGGGGRRLARRQLHARAKSLGFEADEMDDVEDEDDEQDVQAEVLMAVDKGKRAKRRRSDGTVLRDTVFEQGETRDLLTHLRAVSYDHRQRPENEAGEPVQIAVSVVVSSIRAVSEVTMDYNLELFYRESWRDSRLAYDPVQFKNKSEIALHESYSNFLWHPDTFMPNAVASKNPRRQSISHRSLLRLSSNGSVLYSRRLSIVAECPMDLTLFPFDTQLCKLGIESYGYTADQVAYQWSSGLRAALSLHRIPLPDFRIREAYVTAATENYATGDYSRLYVCFVLSRSSGFCFLQLIIPSTAVVITSWVVLWMETEASFQDMISVMLTITFLLFSYNEVMPRVGYLKAMDVYLGVCFCFVFASLIRLALMKYMRQRLLHHRDASLMSGLLPALRLVNGVAAATGTNKTSAENEEAVAKNRPNARRATLVLHTDEKSNGIATLVASRPVETPKSERNSWFRFSPTFVQRFHIITQTLSAVSFILFCCGYFLLYASEGYRNPEVEAACDRRKAIYFADIGG